MLEERNPKVRKVGSKAGDVGKLKVPLLKALQTFRGKETLFHPELIFHQGVTQTCRGQESSFQSLQHDRQNMGNHLYSYLFLLAGRIERQMLMEEKSPIAHVESFFEAIQISLRNDQNPG